MSSDLFSWKHRKHVTTKLIVAQIAVIIMLLLTGLFILTITTLRLIDVLTQDRLVNVEAYVISTKIMERKSSSAKSLFRYPFSPEFSLKYIYHGNTYFYSGGIGADRFAYEAQAMSYIESKIHQNKIYGYIDPRYPNIFLADKPRLNILFWLLSFIAIFASWAGLSLLIDLVKKIRAQLL